jgi:hypothetical protein
MRYPVYLLKNKVTLALRCIVPVVTFPVGAGGEAYVCWFAAQQGLLKDQPIVQGLCYLQVVVNVVGGLAAYPGIISKAVKSVAGDKKVKAARAETKKAQ